MKLLRKKNKAASDEAPPPFPGIPSTADGSEAIVAMETAASDAAGAYPITPSTQMGEGFAAAVAAGQTNVNGRRLIFFEPEGEHAAAAVTAGMNLCGLRSTNFSSGQGIAYMHESLYAAVGKRLTYVLNVACRAMTKQALNVHAGHDDYHAVDDTGFFQIFAKDVQESADLNLICHRIAELSLNPGICAQDGFLTSHVIESLRMPEHALVKAYLGDPADMIDAPTPAQRLVFGEQRRRIPELFDYDYPAMLGVVQNQDSYAQGVAAQRPFYFDHIRPLTDLAMEEYAALTGRRYQRAIGYRLDDAEYVIAGQGSVVSNAEAVCDHVRETRGIKLGVLNVTMFRPFPTDLITKLLAGKKAVTVMERLDQPLAVEGPLIREIRAALAQGVENGRTSGEAPYAGVASLKPNQVPDLYSACFGLGSRDLQPGDILATVANMLPDGHQRRQYYLGIDFVRPETRLPKLQIWQDQMLEGYPDIEKLALKSVGDVNLMPKGALSIRIHSVGGWGAITMGKNLALTASELLGCHVKANPKYGSEKKGQPTTFYASLAPDPIRLNCELKHVNVVLAPDPRVFHHAGSPLQGLTEGGIFVIQSDLDERDLWESLPPTAQRDLKARSIRLYALDAFAIAQDEASNVELRYRMQGTAFMGAFFKTSPMLEDNDIDESRFVDEVRKKLQKKFGHLGDEVVEDNLRVIRRGFEEVKEVEYQFFADGEDEHRVVPHRPGAMGGDGVKQGIGHGGRFWEQVCHLHKTGEDGIADPFAAISAMPAASSTIRDMSDVRYEVPEFVASLCTGCSQCWVQCPDSAIPGVVNSLDQVLDAAVAMVEEDGPLEFLQPVRPHLVREARRLLKATPFETFGATLNLAYENVLKKLDPTPERRTAIATEYARLAGAVAEFPLTKTSAFFDMPEENEKGSGGLLSITVNPQTCKGCMICVDVCPTDALYTVRQEDEINEKLRRNWRLWEKLPETDDRYVNIASMEEGIGVLPSLLLKQANYYSMMGGDGACMGCGEKTIVHLVLSAVNALQIPRVKSHVAQLDDMIARLDAKARAILASDATLGELDTSESGHVDLVLSDDKKAEVDRIKKMIADLTDLRWRYTEGPSGKGRAHVGFANSTGCSSVWGATYPYNPYPFPWVNHLFQDAPSIAIGVFEGHMRKMADGFIAVRRAQLELDGTYDPAEHEPFFTKFDWQQFDDEEFDLCPPLMAVGGDGAMLDIGFQNLSRLMASGKPIRVMVLDTQVYSNTGGQACTSGYLGQVSDMAGYGAGQHGKTETRKELLLIAMAHREVFVVESSQGLASHLLEGVLRGLQSRKPAVFIMHSPCPPEHGLADDSAHHAARLAVESRAFPLAIYDPDRGPTMAERLSLAGNPALEDTWPTYDLAYIDEEGNEQTKSDLPLTIADWAAAEGRFKKHFKPLSADLDDDEIVPFAEYLDLSTEDREGKTAYIYVIDNDKHLSRLAASPEIAELAEERLSFWTLLKHMAGVEVPEGMREDVEGDLEGEMEELRTKHAVEIAELRAKYPTLIARRLAEGLLNAAGDPNMTVADLLANAKTATPLPAFDLSLPTAQAAAPVAAASAGTATAVEAAPVAVEDNEEDDGELVMEPYISSARCTSCDECTNMNRKMFAYNDKKQAYFKDPRAGTFKQMVQAAEKCPVKIIHPGSPLNPKEKDLAKWIERAKPFN